MSDTRDVKLPQGANSSYGPYTIYSAGGLFTQDELTTNILLKEAIWRLSDGKFQLFLPQSREIQELDQLDVEAFIRNTDLLEVVKADMMLARFDGLELDSGTVVEFIVAKILGKPTVILRSDFRRSSCTGLSEPYNLMAMNWPRTIEVRVPSYMLWADLFSKQRQGDGGSESLQEIMKAELATIKSSVDEIAKKVIAGFEEVLKTSSPYPPELQEVIYQAIRFSPGNGFDKLLTADLVEDMINKFREKRIL